MKIQNCSFPRHDGIIAVVVLCLWRCGRQDIGGSRCFESSAQRQLQACGIPANHSPRHLLFVLRSCLSLPPIESSHASLSLPLSRCTKAPDRGLPDLTHTTLPPLRLILSHRHHHHHRSILFHRHLRPTASVPATAHSFGQRTLTLVIRPDDHHPFVRPDVWPSASATERVPFLKRDNFTHSTARQPKSPDLRPLFSSRTSAGDFADNLRGLASKHATRPRPRRATT